MTPDEFVKSRQADWSQLVYLLDQYQRGGRALAAADLERLGQLYRAATSDLALAQRDFPHARVTLYLNHLVGRAHAAIYRGDPLDLRRVARFYLETFPRLYRELLPFTLAAFLLFLVPAALAGYALATNPGAAGVVGLEDLAAIMADGKLWTDIAPAERPGASAMIMSNNIRVTITAFAGGITLMALTVYAMVANGLLLGGVMGLGLHYGLADELATFVVAHGVIELSVIFMAGGAGLMMGWSLLSPGLFTRRDALVMAAGRSVRVLFGCVPLLVVAGLVEGFVSPNADIPPALHWAVGVVSGVALYAYLLGTGRPTARTTVRRWVMRARRALGTGP